MVRPPTLKGTFGRGRVTTERGSPYTESGMDHSSLRGHSWRHCVHPHSLLFVFPLLSNPSGQGIKQKLSSSLFQPHPFVGGTTKEREAGCRFGYSGREAFWAVIGHRVIACTVVSELELRARGACIRMRLRWRARLFRAYNFPQSFIAFPEGV